ncbi:MAG TPA: riboflavin synthase, partial [Pyrinomonadaceae bacterium]
MFTGIIEETGSIAAIEKHASGAKMKIAARVVTQDSRDGDSIAVNGVCLTAIGIKPDGFSADVSDETLGKSTLGKLGI